MGFLDFFTVVLTCIWWVHREHRFPCWNHHSCISYRNFESRLRIMIWLFWRERASMHDQTLGSHLIYQNAFWETRLTASSARAGMMHDSRYSSPYRDWRCDYVSSQWNQAKTVAQIGLTPCTFLGGRWFHSCQKKNSKEVLFLTETMTVRASSGNGGTGSNTWFICRK